MIPKKIKIAGYNYTVKEDKNGLRDANRFGYHNCNTNEIFLDPESSDEIKASTLLHEILEGLNWHYALKLHHDQIVRLETTLYATLKDNKLTF